MIVNAPKYRPVSATFDGSVCEPLLSAYDKWSATTGLPDMDQDWPVVSATGDRKPEVLAARAHRAIAGKILNRNGGFKRHLRTNKHEKAGVRARDAVYTKSPSLPSGMATSGVHVGVASCEENGIPTV